jgi:hypothetical protein
MRKLVLLLAMAGSHGCAYSAAMSSGTSSLGEMQSCDPASPCFTGGSGDPTVALATIGAFAVGVLGFVTYRMLFSGD